MYSIHASGTEQEKERKKAIEFSGNGVVAVVVFLAFSLSVWHGLWLGCDPFYLGSVSVLTSLSYKAVGCDNYYLLC